MRLVKIVLAVFVALSGVFCAVQNVVNLQAGLLAAKRHRDSVPAEIHSLVSNQGHRTGIAQTCPGS